MLVLIMGNGMEPKIAIAALVCFFPTLVNMVRGLDAANPQALESLEAAGALEKAEPYVNNVGFSERADVPIEVTFERHPRSTRDNVSD